MDTFSRSPSRPEQFVSIQSRDETPTVIYSFVYFRSALREGSGEGKFYFYFTAVKGSLEFAETRLAENLSRNIQKVVFVNSTKFARLE